MGSLENCLTSVSEFDLLTLLELITLLIFPGIPSAAHSFT